MTVPTLYMEEENKKQGLRISITLHVLILLIALYPILRDDPNENIDKQFAIAIRFDQGPSANSFKGMAAEGAQRARNERVERIRTTPAERVETKSTPKPVKTPQVKTPEPKVPTAPMESEIFEKEIEIEAVESVPEVVNEVPKKQVETKPEKVTPLETNDSPSEIEDVPSQVPSSVPSASNGAGSNSSSPSNQDGTGTGQGKKGKGKGYHKSGNDSSSGIGTGGAGNGAFDGTGKGIFGRQPVNRPRRSRLLQSKNGKIVMKVCIDSKGRSTFVDLIKRGTTIHDKKVIREAIDYVGRFIWEEDPSIKLEQCGRYTFRVDNQTK